MTDNAEQNGNGFVVDDLLNMIVPFEFSFEGSVLRGRWYKYKTNTPSYHRGLMARLRELRGEIMDLSEKIRSPQTEEKDIPALVAKRDDIEDRLQRAQYNWMTDALVEWNAVGHDKQILTIAKETLDTFPVALLSKLNEFFEKERVGENPPSPTS